MKNQNARLNLTLIGKQLLLGFILLQSTIATGQSITFPDGADKVVVPMKIAGDKLFVRTWINGQDAGWFVVDTGAEITLVDNELVDQLKLKTLTMFHVKGLVGRQKSTMHQTSGMSLGKLKIGPGIIASTRFNTFQLISGIDFKGIIGGNILRVLPFTIDPATSTITFHKRSTFHPPSGATEHNIRIYGTEPAIMGKLNDRITGWFTIDTGSDVCLRISPAFQQLHQKQLIDGRRSKRFMGSSAGDTLSSTFQIKLDSLDVFGRMVSEPTAMYRTQLKGMSSSQPSRLEGVIGWEAMSDLKMTFDYQQSKMWTKLLPDDKAQPWKLDGIKPHAKDLAGETDLMHAAKEGDLAIFKKLLEAGANPKAKSNIGASVLFFAVVGGREEIVTLLLKQGTDANSRTTILTESVLGTAASKGNIKIVKILIDAGAELDYANHFGETPLFRAIERGHHPIAQALLTAGAKVNIRNKADTGVLESAVYHGDTKSVQILIDAGVSVHSTDKEGLDAIHIAAQQGHVLMIRMLLDLGAKLDKVSYKGRTPLMYAANWGHGQAVAELLKQGADRTLKDKKEKTALDYAYRSKSYDSIRLLIGLDQP